MSLFVYFQLFNCDLNAYTYKSNKKKLKKEISFTTQGQRSDIDGMTIYRLLPNRYAGAVGSFIFLDHITPKIHTSVNKGSTGSHPHRGIATLSYILNGEDEHNDSAGNYAKVHSGGVQWMKAGNGIIHDESLSYSMTHKPIASSRFSILDESSIKNKS